MGGRARALAVRFWSVNEGVIRFADGCMEDDWRRMVPHEARSVAYLIDHLAYGYAVETRALAAFVAGQQLPPLTQDDLNARNAARWEAEPYPPKAGTMARLREEGERAAAAIERLSDAELDKPARYGPLPEMRVEEFVERIIIGHPGMHLPGIRAELRSARAEHTATN
jgi:hypothetical protein